MRDPSDEREKQRRKTTRPAARVCNMFCSLAPCANTRAPCTYAPKGRGPPKGQLQECVWPSDPCPAQV
eukprot:3884618-Lingulodinium_polyedra.AAC.1